MNIIEEDYKKSNNNKTTKILVILMIITVLISVGIVGAIYYLKITEFKFLFNGNEYTSYDNDLFVFNNGKIYVSIKDMATITDYKAYNGTYQSEGQYSEDTTKCYVQGKNEIANFELNSNIISKVSKIESNEYDYFEIDTPVIQINNKLYVTPSGISKAFNISFYYDATNNQVIIYTLPYLVEYYTANNKNAALSNFNNQKALLYNLLVVADESSSSDLENVKYGVYTLDGKEVLGTKYKTISFMEENQEFLVTTTNDKIGIISSEGITIIQPQYDKLKLIDKNSKLYLVTNNKKQGIVQENGKVLIYPEYDKIGIETKNFPADNIENQYILYDNCIPVYQNGKWGLFNKNGKIIVPIEYDNIGCIVEEDDEGEKINANSVLLISEIKGIVLGQKGANGSMLFGVVNYKGDTIIPKYLSIIYSVTKEGKKEYYMQNVGKTINLLEWVNKNVKL